MKTYLQISLIWLLSRVDCWKPITHPAAYTVQQTFSDHENIPVARSSSNNIIHSSSDSVDSLFNSFNKNDFANDGSCASDKFAIDHESVVDYHTGFAKLEQFSTCLWVRFTKHDGDHVLFTYSVHDEPREIQLWVANVNASSFISMAVRGHSLYRLNYPLAMKKWHHMCTSWNGKTGEWQLWVSSERVGRGFYNRLVGHEIEAGGRAFSGGKSPNGPVATGLHFEITMLQVYKVALSAGKAHRNHKHHHVHKFDSDGEISTTTTMAPPPAVNQPVNPLLANGQFPTRVKINFAGAQPTDSEQQVNTNFVVGQFHTGTRNLQQQLLTGNVQQRLLSQPRPLPASMHPAHPQQIFSRQPNSVQFPDAPRSNSPFLSTYTGFGSNPANVQIIDEANLPTIRFKRQPSEDKTQKKRELVTLTDGSIVDDKFFDTDWYDGLGQFGDNGLKQTLTKRDNLEDEIKEHDREPAEGEVEAVKSYCNHCLIEPFQSALALSWSEAVGGHGVLKAKASAVCGDF